MVISRAVDMSGGRNPPPVLNRLLGGTFWLTLQIPLQIIFSFWSLRLIIETIGPERAGAYRFAFGFGFLQLLFEFGTSSALQRQLSEAWTHGDRAAVGRIIAAGMTFYALTSFLQFAALLAIAYLAVPYTGFEGESYQLVIQLLWLQALTAPCFGVALIISSVLQAARRYAFIPRYELAITVLRFIVLVLGVLAGIDFFWVAMSQTALILILRIAPGLWVMVCELDVMLHFRGAEWSDYKALGKFSFYAALIQISVVLADKVDTTILGFMLTEPGPHIAAYDVVSKPFLLLRQTGGMLASLIIPAVASLAASDNERGLRWVKYDGTRLYLGVLLPVGLLACIHTGSFLSLWFGSHLGYHAAELTFPTRLFLVATLPMAIMVLVQTSIALNRIRVIALSALGGSLINLPVSCYLAGRLGLAGVIWGTVLTSLFANLLVPGIYVFRALDISVTAYAAKALSAPASGALGLIISSWTLQVFVPITHSGPFCWTQALLLLFHTTIGILVYLGGYFSVPSGRSDLTSLASKMRWQ